MAKTVEDLRKSRDQRAAFIHKFGEILTSVWDVDFKQNKSAYEVSNLIAQNKRLRNYFEHEDQNLAKAFSSLASPG